MLSSLSSLNGVHDSWARVRSISDGKVGNHKGRRVVYRDGHPVVCAGTVDYKDKPKILLFFGTSTPLNHITVNSSITLENMPKESKKAGDDSNFYKLC